MSQRTTHDERCWCGSGKSRKKCHAVEKERKDVLTITFDRPVTPASLEMTPGGVVRFYDERGKVMIPQTQTLQRQFDRSKGPKSVFRVSQDGRVPLAASLETSLTNFSRMYVVDTNTRLSGTSSLSVSMIARTEYRPFNDELTVARQEMVAAFELHNVRGSNPEVVAWKLLIDRVRASTDYDPGWRVGIVVDSELDALAEWNARTRPLYGDALLPVNFGLVYASADKRRDSQLNNLMSACDQLASNLRDKIVEVGSDGNFELASVGSGCSAWRLWSVVQADGQTTFTSMPWSARLDSSFRLPPLPRSFRRPR